MSGQQTSQYTKREYNPKVISTEDLEKINSKERAFIVLQPGEAKSPWEKVEGKNYHRSHEGDILQNAINFYQQVVSITEAGFSHAVVENYQYSKGSGFIFRSEYKAAPWGGIKGTTTGGAPRGAFKPRYLQEVFLGTIDEINEKVKDGDWNISYPAVVLGNKILIVKNK